MEKEKTLVKGKFRYNIDFVVDTDLPSATKYKASRGYLIDCPFCNKKRKMNIDNQKNVYSCPACGMSGGMLKLHKELCDLPDTKLAKKDLEARYDGLSEEGKAKVVETKATQPSYLEEKWKVYPLKERSAIYEAWLKMLTIDKEHLDELHSERRGWLSDEDIARLGYKSYSEGKIGKYTYPEKALIEGATVLYDNPDDKLHYNWFLFNKVHSQVPGFFPVGKFKESEHILSQREKDCLLIPVRYRHGEISFFQQKYPPLPKDATPEKKEKYKKYGRYGSYGEKGCSTSGLESIHYAGFDYNSDKTPESVWLTEGVLKADIASTLSGKAFIALIGVSVYSQLPKELEYLKQHGTKRICVAVDMDYKEKKSVKNSLNTICGMVEEAGLECREMSWDDRYKGIDDFLIELSKHKQWFRIDYPIWKKKGEEGNGDVNLQR